MNEQKRDQGITTIDLNQLSKDDKYNLTISSNSRPTFIRQFRDIVIIIFALVLFIIFCWFFIQKMIDVDTTEVEQRWIQSSFFAIAGWVIGYITNRDFGR